MSSSNVTAASRCIHANQLLNQPLYQGQTLLRKITNVIFRILTLGISLPTYRIFSFRFSRTASGQENANLQTIGIKSVQQKKPIEPHSPLGQNALEFARKKLGEYSKTTRTRFYAEWMGGPWTLQPVNREIARLATLYWDIHFKALEDVLKEITEDTWNDPKVLEAADACMKIGYAICVLTLEDLKLFTKKLSIKDKKRTYAKEVIP